MADASSKPKKTAARIAARASVAATVPRVHPILPPLPPPAVLSPPPAAADTGSRRHVPGRGRRRKAEAAAENPQTAEALSPPEPAPETTAQQEPKPRRRRGHRGGRKHRRRSEAAAPAAAETAAAPLEADVEVEPQGEPEARPKRRRGHRGGRKHRRAPKEAAEEAPPAAAAPEAEAKPAPRRRRRRKAEEEPPAPATAAEPPVQAPPRGRRSGTRQKAPTLPQADTPAAQAMASALAAAEPKRHRGRRRPRAQEAPPAPATAAEPPTRLASSRARARTPVTGAPTEEVPPPFAHPAEYEFARILDFYGIIWQYEPRSFSLRWDRGHVTEAFTPDFYLPDLNLYVELTTLKTGLTAEKNRKMRLLRELYPEVNIILLKKRDYLRLLAKYGYGPLSPDQVPDIDRVLITTSKLQQRVGELGAQISRDYVGKEPVLIGVLRGVLCFMADLMRHISVPSAVDFMAISSYDGNGAAAVRILKDLEENIKGRDVLLVEDIVDTGMTLNHILEYVHTKRPASVRVCALLDKRARRIADVPLDYVGFEIPDEFVVGYGLDFHQRFRNLPFIAVLKHQLLP